MFSLQKFFGKDPAFFELLESASREAQCAVGLLSDLIRDETSPSVTGELKECRRRSREIFDRIGGLVVTTFVTALEKEDIEELSSSLYKILKPIDKFAERLVITRAIIGAVDFSRHLELIKQAADTVVELVAQVKTPGNLEKVRKLSISLNQSETNADSLQVELLGELYRTQSQDPLKVILIKDFYDLLEKTIDRQRDAGAVVMNIVLKNS